MADGSDVLVVDDNADLRQALAELLDLEGYAVTVAADGDECLALLQTGVRPCVIVLDLVLPGSISGRDVCARLAGHPEWCRIPLVILSGVNQRPEVTARELGLPADHVLLKPSDLDSLFALVARYCRARAA